MDLQPCLTPETIDAPVVTLDITSLYRDCHRRAYAIAWAYLKDVLTRLPSHPSRHIEQLLPHRWHPAG